MPYEWITPAARPDGAAAPQAELHLWPYRSLPKRGFVIFIAITAALVALPLVAVIGYPVLWGLLPFLVAAVAGIWWALQRNYRDAEIVERLTLWPDRMTLLRVGPKARRHDWEANPYWVRVQIYPTEGRVTQYLTLQGGPREVELGAFLAEEERLAVARELRQALAALR
jgi:uncharacterized membrane protein